MFVYINVYNISCDLSSLFFSVYSVMHKYYTDRDEVNFDTIFNQKIGQYLFFLDFTVV